MAEKRNYRWRDGNFYARVSNEIANRVNAYQKKYDALQSDFQKRNASRKYTYEDAYVSDSADWANSVSKRRIELDAEADSISAYIDRFTDGLDTVWVNRIKNSIADVKKAQGMIADAATKDHEWWSSFKNEDAYKYAGRADGYSKKYDGMTYENIQAALDDLPDGEERQWLQYMQGDLFNDYVRGQSDYQQYVQKGAGMNYASFDPVEQGAIMERGNEYLGAIAALFNHFGTEKKYGGHLQSYVDLFQNLTEDEWNVLAYSVAKDRENGFYTDENGVAQLKEGSMVEQFLRSMEGSLEQSAGEKEAARYKDIPVIADLYAAKLGLSNFATGFNSFFNNNDTGYGSGTTQVAGNIIRESFADDGFNLPKWMGGASVRQALFDLTSTTSQQIPTIAASSLLSAINPAFGTVVGTSLMGTSAAGNAYSEALDKGYGEKEARLYGSAVGALEGTLQYLLGGISKLGGVSSKVATAVSGINSGLARFALQYGGQIASEGLEEGLQEIFDPLLQRAILDADADIDWSQVTYSALLGALSAGTLEIAPTVQSVKEQTSANNAFVSEYGGLAKDVIKNGTEGSKIGKIAEKYQKKLGNGKNFTASQVRKVLESSAQERLTELGEDGNTAKIAKMAVKYASGQELTRAEKKELSHSKFGAQVSKEIRASSMLHNLMETAADTEYKSLESRMEDETPAKVSDTGKAIINGTDQQVDLTAPKIKKITKDSMILEVDGKDVDIDDIEFANEDQWNVFNALKKVEHITPLVASDMVAKVDLTKPVWSQMNGMDEAFTYGYYNYSEADLKAGLFTGNLTKQQLNDAYKLGQYVRKNDVEADETNRVKMRTDADAKLTAEQKAAQQKARIESDDVDVYFMDGKSTVKFDEHTGKYDPKRTAAVNTAKFLKKLGIGGKFVFYESYEKNGKRYYKDANGKEKVAPNGFYDPADGSIYIDLNAGNDGSGTALFTMGHELAHFVKHRSEKQFKILADLVTEAFDKTDMSMHKRVLAKQKFLEEVRGKKVDYFEAHEEVVADAMSTMLTDGSFYDMLMEIKVKDKDLFATIKRFFQKMIAKFKKEYANLTPDQKDAQDIRELKDCFDKIQKAFAEGLVEASENFHAAMESVVEENAKPVSTNEIVTDGAVVTDGNGERHSIRSMKHDIAEGRMFEDLKNVCGWTDAQVNQLKKDLETLVEYMIPYRNILDMNESYGMEGRRFSPYKPNSDPLYKISMDFSTLCSKRLLTQYVIEQLQLRENRPMSAEEQMAIRDMLNEYRKVEKGLQVACAMCYVEAARLKSPKQIQRWLDDPTPHLINYFALKNTEFNNSVKKAQADFKESKGYDRNAPKKDMKQADVRELNKIGPKMRSQYKPSVEEQAIIDKAKTLPNSTYLTAGNLAALSETDPDLYAAYTSFVRTATRSKSLETDEPYYYGDSTRDNGNGIIVSDSFIEAVNKENGMRFSSWSDWRIQHLLDYITAVIDNSVRGAAMHGYTKFGDEVRVLGKTGMMFNMSGVAGTQTGLNEDGSLNFSDTESIDVNEAIQLREEFPEHAGLQCIGVSNEHIIALLRSDIIDYVIPYHASGLNAALRRMADIYGWKDYTGTQHASIDKSIKFENAVDKEHWHEEPVFSEFFVGYDTGMSGIEAMRASAEKYKQMCKDRGLTPKFEQFSNEDNYWKLLIDRKMINQQTGNLIKQKAVTPTFDFDVIKGVVDKFVDNYDAGLEARALNHIVENWDSIPQRIKDLKKQGSTKANKATKAVNTLANQTVAAQPKDAVKNSDRSHEWKPKLDNTEWGIVNYVIKNNQGMAITSTCNMFFKKSRGRTLFGIYSTDDSTLLYASNGQTAEKEHTFVGLLREEYKNGNVTDTSAEGLRALAKAFRMQRTTNNNYGTGDVAPGRFDGNDGLHGGSSGLYASAALRNVLENIFQKETAGRTGDGSVKKSERVTQIASDFTSHMENIVKTKHGWYAKDVFKYVEEHPEVAFIERIYHGSKDRANAKEAKKLVEQFMNDVDDVKVLENLSWYMGEAYGDKDRTWNPYDGATYPYRGAVRTFRNAVKKRINAIMTEKVGGTNLGIKNGEVTLDEVKDIFKRLNSNEEIGQFAEKVFAAAEKLGVNIRFVNATLYKGNVAGDNLGDMVEYKTSYFNDTTFTDQRKASTILHELIHACTVYVMHENAIAGDVSYGSSKSENYNRIANAATRLNRIYMEIQNDPDFKDQYGIKNAKEMVAELANEEFVGLMKKKNLWDKIVDWICELFGIRRGTSAYDNARLCLDYILDNPEVSEYKAHAMEQRSNARYNGYDVFGQTRFSERGDGTSNRSLLANAFEGITQNSEEYKLIQKYKGHIKDLNALDKALGKINAEIREIRFGKGKYDAKKLSELETKAKAIAGEITRHDKKLLSLEASEPLREVIERERKKEAQKTKAHVQEIQQNKKVRAEQTELRHKIRKTIRDLDKILNRGNKKQNVKEDLQPVVTKALQAAEILFTENYGNYDMLRNGIGANMSDAEEALVDSCAKMLKELDKMPTDGYENWQARQEAENRLKTKMSKLKEVFARERKRLNNTTVSSILGELADAYASLEKSEQSYVQGAYSEAVHNFLKNLQSEVGGTIVMDMTKDQLESVYAAYKMVLTTVRKANQMFNEELKQSREQLGNAVIEEVLKAGGVHLLGTKMGDAVSQFDWNNMKPIWVANRIGSDTFGKLMNGLFKGQYNFARDIDEVKKFKLKMDEKYKPRNWDAEKQYEFESSTGKKFSLNLQQIMSLYAFSKRDQAYSHLLNGGFVFEENSTVVVDGKLGIKKTYIHKGAASYKLNEATLNDIISSLTAEQKSYVDEMQKYLSDVMGAKGNEVSMQLYGIKMFKEQFYFPLRSSGAYMERAKEAELKKQQGQINLVNSGFTHSVKPEAKNPIVLSGFMDVWAEHCNEMSMYHSMVLPMEDFRKVYNYSTIHDEKMESASVYQTIQDAYGKAATNYIDQLYKELNAGATVDPRETPWKSLISKFKKSSVMLSLSVWVQQFSSIGRAYAVIDPKYFTGAKVDSNTKLAVADEMKKYAPVAIIKEMGGFDTGTKGNATAYIKAEKYGKGERIKGFAKDEQYRSDIMGYMPTKADEKTWCAIWESVKREIKANNPKMDVKSDEFLKLAGERFSEVIEKTQVYDSVLARSANMRSKGNFMAMATAFMAEPTTTINLIEDAIRGGNGKYIARVFGSVAVTVLLNNALASIVYALRDDDEDETFIEKYFQSFTSGLIDDFNPMSYYPFLKDIYSLLQGYDVERTDMAVFSDVRDAAKQVLKYLMEDTSEMDDDEIAEHNKNLWGAFGSCLDAVYSAFGVPLKNVRRDTLAIVNGIKTIGTDLSGERATTWNSFWDNVGAAVKDTIPIYALVAKDKAKTDKLYTAIISGDKSYLSRLKSTYKTDSAYQSAVVKALRKNDPRIKAAAQANVNGNAGERNHILNEIKAEGKFSASYIIDAINAETSAIRNDAKPDKVAGQYEAYDFVEAVSAGDANTAKAVREDIIATYVANGKTQTEAENAFKTDVKSSVNEAYSYGTITKATAEKMLVEYVDMDEEDATDKITYWDFCKTNPNCDLSESKVLDYLEFAEPAHVSLEVYEQFVAETKDLADIKDEWGDVEVTKREQVLEVIDSLPLSWQQKDALYLAYGYAESKIWDVPW